MSWIDVDTNTEACEGYRYTNRDGNYEKVSRSYNGIVRVWDSTDDTISVYIQDIPKLIKALQTSYDNGEL